MKWKLLSIWIIGLVFVGLVVASVWDYNPSGSDPSLVAHWKFDGNALDETGINNGTINGATYTNKGKFAGAYEFDGDGDYIDVGNLSLGSGAFTISLWAYSKDTSKSVITKGVSRSTAAARDWDIWGIGLTGTRFQLSNGTDFIAQIVNCDTSPLNQWHHIVGTFDGTTNTNGVKIYSDGLLCGQATSTDNKVGITNKIYIGGNINTDYEFNGTIDEVMIFNRSLTASEILELYNESLVSHQVILKGSGDNELLNETGLVGHWNLNGNALDSSGEGNDGTVTGAIVTNKGKFKQAYEFDGVNDQIEIADGDWNEFSDLTVSAWIKPNILIDTTEILGSGTSTASYNLFLDSNGGLYLGAEGEDSDVNQNFDSNNGLLTVGVWTHIIFVRDTTADTGQWFINGVADLSEEDYTVGNWDSGASFYAGRARLASSYFNGSIDEVRIYNRSLSQSEILQLYNQSLTSHSIIIKGSPTQSLLTDSSLVSKWDMEYFNGTAVRDYKGINNGTVVGATYTNKGRFKGAYEFDGDGDYIIKADISPFISTGDYTNCLWINAKDVTDISISLWATGYKSGIHDRNLYILSDNTVVFRVFTTGIRTAISTTTLIANQWYFICGTIDSSAGNSIWINGVNENTNALGTSGYNFGSTGDFIIAGAWPGTYLDFNGSIDEVMIFNRSLSASEILSLYNESLTSNKFIIKGSPSAI